MICRNLGNTIVWISGRAHFQLKRYMMVLWRQKPHPALALKCFQGQCQTAARIQLVLQIDQGNLDGMRELASADAVYIAKAKSAAVFRHLSQGKWRWKARAKGRLPFGSGSLPSFLWSFLKFWFNQAIGMSFSLIYYIDFFCLRI